MTIYRKSTSFARRIYRKHYGEIPKDTLGRSYDIHHIDGNHSNDEPTNLIAVSIQEHYDIHYANCDWGACYAIALRMKKSPNLISELASKSNKERIANGTHHLLKRSDGSTVIGDAYKAGLRTQAGHSNSRFDNTTYTFIHNPTGNNVTMTQYDFVKSFNLNKGAVQHRTVKGWQVFRELV